MRGGNEDAINTQVQAFTTILVDKTKAIISPIEPHVIRFQNRFTQCRVLTGDNDNITWWGLWSHTRSDITANRLTWGCIPDKSALRSIKFHLNMIHFLNFDVLSLIFIEALHTGSSSLLTLQLVTRAWYEITGRIPQLWTRLVLNRKSHFINSKYAQLYLQNSGSLPIDIHITLPDDVDASEIDSVTFFIEDVADLLHGQTSRFRSFHLHVCCMFELAVNWRTSSSWSLKTGLHHYLNLWSSEFKAAHQPTLSSTL